jgi:hypothetical protein
VISKNLFKAIYAKGISVGNFNTAIGGRFHFGEAPKGVAYPYAVYHLISNVPDRYFGEDHYSARIQINLFDDDNSAGDIADAFQYCTALFDDCTLTITADTFVHMERELDFLNKDIEAGIWQYILQYHIYAVD